MVAAPPLYIVDLAQWEYDNDTSEALFPTEWSTLASGVGWWWWQHHGICSTFVRHTSVLAMCCWIVQFWT